MKFIMLVLSSAVINNIVLTFFLGTCPFIALSKNMKAAFGMGMAVTFVIVVTAIVNHAVHYFILVPLGLDFLDFVVFILSIAAIVQMLEIMIERFIPALYMAFGIYLPLITVNCAILGVSLFMILREYGFLDTLAFSFGSGLGWMIAITGMAGLRKYLALSKPARLLGEAGIMLLLAGFMALAFFGFRGMLQ